MFEIKPLARGLAVAFGGLACALIAVAPVQAQDAQRLDKVEITGSSIKRIDGETALPVQVLTREDIVRTGSTNTEQLLRTLSAVDPGGTATTSTAAGASTGGISTASLRGLGSARTLVLINGRRIAPYGTSGDASSVDVNSIPIAAIERIEVLKDGASAVYGSDAIAGVINFILRKDYQGAGVSAEYGSAWDGKGKVGSVTGSYGYGDLSKDRFNVSVMATYQKTTALYGRDRAFASSGVNEAALNDTTSGNTFPGNISGIRPVGRDPVDNSVLFGTGNPLAGNCAPSVTSPLFSSRQCRFDPSGQVALLPDTERYSAYAGFRFALTQNIELFAEASYAHNSINTIIQPVPISDQFALPDNNPLYAALGGVSRITVKPGSKYYPTAYITGLQFEGKPYYDPANLPDLNVRYRSVVTGNRDLTNIATQPRVAFGLNGSGAGWDFDAAYLYTQSELTEKVNGGFPALSKILPILNSGNVNFWGPNDPAVISQIKASEFLGDAYVNKTSLQSVSGKASRELFNLPAGAVAIALGGEYRKETYNQDPSLAIQSGDISGYGGNQLPIDRSRNVYSVFAETAIPILRNLEAGAALRYDNYENTGSKVTPKVQAKWTPAKELLIRGSWSQGFRAPSLTELYAPQLIGVTAPGLSDPLRCSKTNDSNDCKTQFPILSGGNPQLKPETSDNFALGFVFEPVNNFSFGVDAFRINLKEAIIAGVPAPVILGDLTQWGSLVTRGPVNVAGLPGPIVSINQTNLNQGKSVVEGMDINAKLRLPAVEAGRFTIGLSGTYTRKYDITLPDGSVDKAAGTFSNNLATSGVGGAVPRWKHYLTLDWASGPWAATIAQKFQAGYKDVPGTFEDLDPASPDYTGPQQHSRVASFTTIDLFGAYSGIKNLTIGLGVRNLFNIDPPYTNAGGQNFFQAGYDPTYADPRGRFFYGRLAYSFK